jgi:hypothetical protein
VEAVVVMIVGSLEGGDMLWKEGREDIRFPSLPTGMAVRSMRHAGGRSLAWYRGDPEEMYLDIIN